MGLAPGTRLGVYEIVGSIGAGGMGEVYRARDSRLGRDVAVKVLPEVLAIDPTALARFEREMQTLAALSNPYIVAIYDVGKEGAIAYAVTELLDGETLAALVARGALPIRKTLEYGVQIAKGLAAAHDRGIVHRDLKPANIFVTSAGHIKVLDFGLARSVAASPADGATRTDTSPGIVMGTVGYMSPEQARGQVVDHRADIFAFGCVMYELITGRRAFQRDSSADTLSAILKEDPPPISQVNAIAPPALERVVQRCLEKNPEERFQSARDLAFALDALSSGGTGAASGAIAAARPRRAPRVAVAAAAMLLLAGAFLLGRALSRPPAPGPIAVDRLTFERGTIHTARFTSDGVTFVYGAAWNGAPSKVFIGRTDTGESRPLELPEGDLRSVSRSGEMAVLLAARYPSSWTPDGTLARGGLLSSSVRTVLEHVRDADFLPDGTLAVVRRVAGKDRLEVPQGTVVFETPGYISHVRVSPDGARVGFLEHPLYGDDRGFVAVYEKGQVRRVSVEYGGIEGLAWTRDGNELWTGGGNEAVWKLVAVDSHAAVPKARDVYTVPTNVVVYDIDDKGRVLLSSSEVNGSLRGAPADGRERDLSWHGWTLPGAISRDGRMLLSTMADSKNPNYEVLLRPMDGGSAVTIGAGRAQELSPDGKWALSILPSEPRRVVLLPTGAGESRQLDIGSLDPTGAVFVPPGSLTVVVVGVRNAVPGIAIVDLRSGTRIDLALPMLRGRVLGGRRFMPTYASPDGSLLAIATDDGKVLAWKLTPNPATEPRELASLADNEVFAGWTTDPSRIYVAVWDGLKVHVDSLDISSGRRTTVRTVTMDDAAGMLMTSPDLLLSADAKAYVVGYTRMLSTLYLVTGLK